jgi:hypothetical protein
MRRDRTNDKELPLFNWRPPAKFIAFPASKRIGAIRRVVDVLESKSTERARESYWHTICENLRLQMEKTDIHPDEIARQITDFRNAVQDELVRRRYEKRSG